MNKVIDIPILKILKNIKYNKCLISFKTFGRFYIMNSYSSYNTAYYFIVFNCVKKIYYRRL